MAYVVAADLGIKSKKSWAQGFLLSEADGDAAYITTVIADVEARVNLLMDDDFAPEVGDADVTLECTGSGGLRLYLPRRCRSITTLKTRNYAGTLTTETAANYRLRSSLDSTGTAMVEGAFDFVELVNPISTGTAFPYGTQAVQIVGKFGWASPPNAIKRLVSILVFDEVKPQNSVLHQVEQMRTETTNYTFNIPDPDSPTGITKADEIIRRYRRNPVMVG